MRTRQTIRYWDSGCFIAWFNKEAGRYDKCKATLDKAEAGEVLLVVSAITLIEVIKLKNHNIIPKDKEEIIKAYFQNEFISVRNVDRNIGEIARDLIWGYNVQPKDSIHVATALFYEVPILNTFDRDLIKLSKLVGGNPSLTICEPDIVIQEGLFDKD